MKDLYNILGIKPDASQQTIKKAFRKLAIDLHPDKGGDEEKMSLLNEAYQTLINPEKRRAFNSAWEAYQGSDLDQKSEFEPDGHLKAGTAAPYSQSFRKQHQALIKQYESKPLMKKDLDHPAQAFESGIYSIEEIGTGRIQYHDIYAFIQAITALGAEDDSPLSREALTPVSTLRVFMDFLSGSYYGAKLISLKQHLASEIRGIASKALRKPELLLYEGIFEIVLMTEKTPDERSSLIFSIKKITDYAKNLDDSLLGKIIPLFYNKFFRNLYAYAMHLHWNASEDVFESNNLDLFDGRQEAKELLEVLRDRLANSDRNENLSKLIRYIKLIFNFEKDKHEIGKLKTAEEYREGAFHLLDWLPVFIDHGNKNIIANIFLQIGIRFQQASRIGVHQALKMADERLAFKLYLTAAEIGHHTSPDLGIYANTQAIKYISVFEFQDEMLSEVLPALKKRTLISVDVFPFFDNNQSNTAFLRNENKTLHLMRKLLNAMVTAYEYNKTHSEAISVEHSAVTILYQVYEACLKNWYKEEFDPAVEKKFRLDLMGELLHENGWTPSDVEERVDFPWIMVDRDEAGWIRPIDALPYAEEEECSTYRTINGMEINNSTGEIRFFMTPWTEDRDAFERVLTLFDLEQMLEKNVSGAIFSLDPADPYKPFHPYNLMRFSPSQLLESELLNTMLLTDYTLKFLTTNQEVQGQHPFDQRPVASMIKHLPDYLTRFIKEFHKEQHAGAMHRFWIEAEEIDVAFSDEGIDNKNLTRVGVEDLKMVVKKHRMERDIHGELKDVGNEDEGWPIYVLSREEWRELERGARVINGNALIFIYAEFKVYFWENNELLKAHVAPQDYRETLIYLFKEPRNGSGKVDENSENSRLRYRATKEMAHQAGLSHRYSPEFIFAHEFTTHYNELAQYLPEFARLKELSKISSLIRVMNGIRSSNKESIEALDYILSASSSSSSSSSSSAAPPATNTYTRLRQAYISMNKKIKGIFKTWSKSLSTTALYQKCRDQIRKIKEDVGTLHFSAYSAEVNEECERQYDYSYRNSRGYSWSEIKAIIDAKRSDIASQYTKSKQASVRSQLMEIFSSKFGSSESGRLIDLFINGNISPLTNALLEQQKQEAHQEIKKQFPSSPLEDITLGLDQPDNPVVNRIANAESCRQLGEQKVCNDNLEAGFNRINLGKNSEPIDLKGKCLWVPASVRHDVQTEDLTGSVRSLYFVYGGVNLQARINRVAGGNAPLTGNPIGARGPGGGGGSGGGPGPNNPTGANRFKTLIEGANKNAAIDAIRSGTHGLTEQQAAKIIKTIKGSTNESASTFTIKRVEANGNVRIAAERPGHDGFQRFSYNIKPDGSKQRIVQTAYDSTENLVHQRPGAAKNNLYDVKPIKKR